MIDAGLLRSAAKSIEKHNDEFYKLVADNKGKEITKEQSNMATWHAHEIAKNLYLLHSVADRLEKGDSR